jgi:uncharacterized iron-regulated membrane protein
LPAGLDLALAAAIAASPDWRQIQCTFSPAPASRPDALLPASATPSAAPAGLVKKTGPLQILTLAVSDSHRGRPDLRREITFDPAKAAVTEIKEFSSQSTGRQLRTWVRWLHTGEALGWIGQTVSALACLALLVLIWTGFALSWRRFFGRKNNAPAGAP